jgi:gliding motility-associated-like protein
MPADTTLCLGNALTLTADGGLTGNYVWTPNGETTQSITVSPNVSTTYGVVFTYGDGCTETGSVVVDVAQNFSLTLTNNTDPNVFQGDSVTLTAEATGVPGPFGYLWSVNGEPQLSTSNIFGHIAVVDPTLYVVTVTSPDGCANTASVQIGVVVTEPEFMNAFSPNGDQTNDVFYIINQPVNSTIVAFQIFDRWGQKVYDNLAGQWDGTLNGNQLPSDVYMYKIILRKGDGTEVPYDGDITLLK